MILFTFNLREEVFVGGNKRFLVIYNKINETNLLVDVRDEKNQSSLPTVVGTKIVVPINFILAKLAIDSVFGRKQNQNKKQKQVA